MVSTFEVAHRPWPLPTRPWMMAQRWEDLLFMHWPVDAAALRARLPAGLQLDLYEGTAWLSITPFHLSHLRLRGLPPAGPFSAFHEINVRTYVTVGAKPGVHFFSLDASRLHAVLGARLFFHLPYEHAEMSMAGTAGGGFIYRSRRKARESSA